MTFLRDYSDGVHVAQAKHGLHGKKWAMSRCGMRLPIKHATEQTSTCITCNMENIRAFTGVVHHRRSIYRTKCGEHLRAAGVPTDAPVTCLLCLSH